MTIEPELPNTQEFLPETHAGHTLPNTNHSWFRVFAERTSSFLGKPVAFLGAVSFVLAWAASGPFFKYSETWQIVINTATTIITFLMVFLLQSTQMRDSVALHLKLNELLRAVTEARTSLVTVEKYSDDRLEELRNEFVSMADELHCDDASTTAQAAHPLPPVASSPADNTGQHTEWMDLALAQAEAALRAGEAPIGCVIINAKGAVIAGAYNTMHAIRSPVAHAEINAFIAGAGKFMETECLTLVSTLAPCVMCVGAAAQAGVTTIIFGLTAPADAGQDRVETPSSPKATAPTFIGGVRAKQSEQLFRQWLEVHDQDPSRSAQREYITQLLALIK